MKKILVDIQEAVKSRNEVMKQLVKLIDPYNEEEVHLPEIRINEDKYGHSTTS